MHDIVFAEAAPLEKIKDFFRKKNKKDGSLRDLSDDDIFTTRGKTSGTASFQILNEILGVPSNEKRLVVGLSDRDWASIYQPKRGNEKLVSALESSAPGSIYAAFPGLKIPQNMPTKEIFKIVDDLSLDGLPASPKYSILLNIKNQIADYFTGVKTPKDFDEAKQILIKALDHRNFIAALDTAKAQDINPSVLGSTNPEEVIRYFDPRKMLVQFSPSTIRLAAIAEWDSIQKKQKTSGSSVEDEKPSSASRVDDVTEQLITFIEDQIDKLGGIIPADENVRKKLAKELRQQSKMLIKDNDRDRRRALWNAINNYPAQKVADVIRAYVFGQVTTGSNKAADTVDTAADTVVTNKAPDKSEVTLKVSGASAPQLAKALKKAVGPVKKTQVNNLMQAIQRELEKIADE